MFRIAQGACRPRPGHLIKRQRFSSPLPRLVFPAARSFSISRQAMTTSSDFSKNQQFTSAADSYQLLPNSSKSGSAEDALYEKQIAQVKEWWASPRYEGIKRPYTPEHVVSKRGTLMQTYPSSLMARKLWNLLEERAAEEKPIHTRLSLLHYNQKQAVLMNLLSWCN